MKIIYFLVMTSFMCHVSVGKELSSRDKYLVIDPTLPALSDVSICDNNNDGFGVFDLTVQDASILAAQSGAASDYFISYHETFTDANTGGSPVNSTMYNNLYAFTQIVYVRIKNVNTNSFVVGSFEVNVNPSPIAFLITNITLCDTDSNRFDGSALVDLTTQTSTVLAQQALPPNNYTVGYYESQAGAESGFNAIITASAYSAANSQVIWIRIADNATGCYAVASFTIRINSPLVLTTPTELAVCDDDASPNDLTHVFDLTIKDSEISSSPDALITYYPSLADAQNNIAPISDPTAYVNPVPTVQTIGVAVTSVQGCRSYTTLDIRVLPIPTPLTNPPALTPQCDYNNMGDMMEMFDLTVNAAYMANGDPTLSFHYFYSITDAVYNVNEILTPTIALAGSNVWVRVENNRVDNNDNHCYQLVEQPLTVYPAPNPVIVSNDTLNTVYVDGSNNVVRPLLLECGLNGNYSYEWYENNILVDTNSTYLINTASPTGASRVYTVSVINLYTGCYWISTAYTVLQSSDVGPPAGIIAQGFTPGDTLASLTVTGSAIQWYSLATDRNSNSAPLPLSTVLVDGTTYYASQTIGGIESAVRLPVTVHVALGLPTHEIVALKYAPNPVKDILNLESASVIRLVQVFNLLGQKVAEQSFDNTHVLLNLSDIKSGSYIIKLQSETAQKTIRIIKQ
jgi:hypothetical protein